MNTFLLCYIEVWRVKVHIIEFQVVSFGAGISSAKIWSAPSNTFFSAVCSFSGAETVGSDSVHTLFPFPSSPSPSLLSAVTDVAAMSGVPSLGANELQCVLLEQLQPTFLQLKATKDFIPSQMNTWIRGFPSS